mmetsp:Transcript_2543/g.6000  ORF Transcript_2543/g.6000 Transcript_2543/m.6000 type:complete len:200 (+) Transcript_2543:561-1160(+)
MLLQDLVEPSVVEVDVLLQVEERIADLLCFHLKGAQCCTLLTTSHGYVDVFLQLVQQLLGLPHVLGSEAANLLDVPVECLEEVLLRDVLRAELPRDLRAAHDRERGNVRVRRPLHFRHAFLGALQNLHHRFELGVLQVHALPSWLDVCLQVLPELHLHLPAVTSGASGAAGMRRADPLGIPCARAQGGGGEEGTAAGTS